MAVRAVILAGGCGARYGSATPKQFLFLQGKKMYQWALDAFNACPDVDVVFLVYPEGWHDEVKSSGCGLVVGGATGQESLWHALQAMPCGEDDWVVIHDADRPMVTPGLISATIQAAKEHGAATCGRMTTTHIVEGNMEKLAHNLDVRPKRNLFITATPACYPAKELRAAYSLLQDMGRKDIVTPCELWLELGKKVAAVESTVVNMLKVNTRQDMEAARRLLTEPTKNLP